MDKMKKIESFKVNHLDLKRGIYVSRRDVTPGGDVITTFDIRMTEPNREPHIPGPAMHAMEHLAATYLRNDREWADRIVYWGPMGCLTGNYLIVQGRVEPRDILQLVRRTMAHVAMANGPIPGATPMIAATTHSWTARVRALSPRSIWRRFLLTPLRPTSTIPPTPSERPQASPRGLSAGTPHRRGGA